MSSRGILIVVEGIDGAGKTTQVKLLEQSLSAAGEEVVVSKEPTDGPWGRKIREAAQTHRLSLKDELHAFVEDRRQHVREVIQPALDRGCVVILDRYYYSTIAYQGSRGANVDQLAEQMARLAPRPKMVFLIDIDPASSLERIRQSRGEIPNAFETAENLARVRAVFNRLAETDPLIWKLDGTQAIDDIHRQILDRVVTHALTRSRDGQC